MLDRRNDVFDQCTSVFQRSAPKQTRTMLAFAAKRVECGMFSSNTSRPQGIATVPKQHLADQVPETKQLWLVQKNCKTRVLCCNQCLAALQIIVFHSICLKAFWSTLISRLWLANEFRSCTYAERIRGG